MSKALEERNAIKVLSRTEMSGTPEALSFFKAIGRIPLARAQKKVKLEEDAADDFTSGGKRGDKQ